jgi:hypothetical protein
VYVDLLENGHTTGVDEADAAELEPRVLVTGETVTPPLFTADEMALISELTAPEGSLEVGFASTEDSSEAKDDPIETAGLVKDPMAEDKAGAAVTAGSLPRDETREENAGLPPFPLPLPTPTPAPTPAPADTPGRLPMTDDAALAKEEAALLGMIGVGLEAIELNKLEMAGATEAAGRAVERKPSAEEAAFAAFCPTALGMEPRMEESWEGAPDAASTSEEAAPVGMAALLPAMELKRAEISGATDAAGLAVERKFNAEEAAAAAPWPRPLAAFGAEVAADATEPRSDES